MKFIKSYLFLLLISLGTVSAQCVPADVFKQKTVTWYGLDFTMAKFIGDFNGTSAASPEEAYMIRDVYFKSWNSVVVKEKKKYDIAKYFQKDSVIVDLTAVGALNAQVNLESMMLYAAPASFTRDQIQEAVQKYDTKDKTGLGLVFIVESFDKTKALGTINVVFFDIVSKQILLAKRLGVKAGGFGLRNYWVSTAYQAMKLSKINWKTWKRETGVK